MYIVLSRVVILMLFSENLDAPPCSMTLWHLLNLFIAEIKKIINLLKNLNLVIYLIRIL